MRIEQIRRDAPRDAQYVHENGFYIKSDGVNLFAWDGVKWVWFDRHRELEEMHVEVL